MVLHVAVTGGAVTKVLIAFSSTPLMHASPKSSPPPCNLHKARIVNSSKFTARRALSENTVPATLNTQDHA